MRLIIFIIDSDGIHSTAVDMSLMDFDPTTTAVTLDNSKGGNSD